MSLKRKLTQDDLRKAMSEHKKKISVVKKIESPLAKYNDAGQLMCILCKTIVRSETVWAVHLNSKIHKENIALAKKTKLEAEHSLKTVSSYKRSSSPSSDPVTNKKIKSILKNGSQLPTQNLQPESVDNNFKQLNDAMSSGIISTKKTSDTDQGSIINGNTKNIETEKGKEKEKSKNVNDSVLPERFFDDPVMDAKIRNVEYKDPIEEEWEKFQKEIKEETAQSAQIIADDQEEATTERQLDEIEEQIRHWSRVMDLVKRKEQVQANDRRQDNINDDISSGDEVEFDEFLDWRAKNAYK